MKRAMFLFCGLCWFMFGLGVGIFSFRYLASGAGSQDSIFVLQIPSPVSSGSILIGLVHIVGFFMLTILCLAIGAGLFLHGLVPHQSDEQTLEPPKHP
jgi:TRAP-type C4-dicarboxylate transport system permease small subunit